MKTCPACHNNMEDDVLFCNNCGQRVETASQTNNMNYQQQPYQQQPYQQQAYQQPQQDSFDAARQTVGHSLDTVAGYSEFDGGLLQLIGWNL